MRALHLSVLLFTFVSSQQISVFPSSQSPPPAWTAPLSATPANAASTVYMGAAMYSSAAPLSPYSSVPGNPTQPVNPAQQQVPSTLQQTNPFGNPGLVNPAQPQGNPLPQQIAQQGTSINPGLQQVYPTLGNPALQGGSPNLGQQQQNPALLQTSPQQPAQGGLTAKSPSQAGSQPLPNLYQSAPVVPPTPSQTPPPSSPISSSSSVAASQSSTSRSFGSQYTRTRKGRGIDPRRPMSYAEQQQQLIRLQQQQQQSQRSPTPQPQRPATPPTQLPRLPLAPTPLVQVVQPSYGPPAPQVLQSRAAIAVGARPVSGASSLYPSSSGASSLYPTTGSASTSLYPTGGSASTSLYPAKPAPVAGSPTVDLVCKACVCDKWSKCCVTAWTSFCDGLSATVCASDCTGQYSGSEEFLGVRKYPASVGEFCGRGIWMRPVECEASQGLQCLASSNVQTTKAEIGLCFQVTPPPPATGTACSDATPRCSCTVEKCGGTRGWNGVQGVCQAGETTSDFEMQNCQVTPDMCLQTSDKCECAFSSCWGWTSTTSQCVIQPQCEDRRVQLADLAVQGFLRRTIQVLAWDFDSTIVGVDTAGGSYPDLAYITDRIDQDFVALAKAAKKQGLKQAITSYNSIGMVFVDGQLTGGPALLKAILAKVLGEDNNFLIFAFESKKPDAEGKNIHLQMLMQQLRIQHKSAVLLIDDYDVNVKLAKTAGYSTAKARTGRGVDLRMLAS